MICWDSLDRLLQVYGLQRSAFMPRLCCNVRLKKMFKKSNMFCLQVATIVTISDLGSWKLALENTLKRWPLNSLTIWHLLDSHNCSEVALIVNRPQSQQLRMSAEIWGQSDHQEYSRMICCWKTNGLEINLCDTFHVYPIEFWFFPLSGGKEIIHRFRNSFRNASTTTAPASATHISHMTLPRASATSFSKFLLPRPQPHYVFQRFWLWLVSFPFILALGPSFAFILALGPSFAFHFGLLSLHFLLFYPFGPSLPFILACFSSALGLDT